MRSASSHARRPISFTSTILIGFTVVGLTLWQLWSHWSADYRQMEANSTSAFETDIQNAAAAFLSLLNSFHRETQPASAKGILAAGPVLPSAPMTALRNVHFDHQLLQATSSSWWPVVARAIPTDRLKVSTNEPVLVLFKSSDQIRKEWLALLWNVSKNSTDDRWDLRVVDPSAVLGKIPSSGAPIRLSMWSPNGVVVGHSQSAYLGTSLLNTPYWNQRAGTMKVRVGNSPIDHLPARWMAAPIGSTGFYLALEKSPEPARRLQQWMTQSGWLRLGGILFSAIGLVLGFVLLRATRSPRRISVSAIPLPETSLGAVADAIQNGIVETRPAKVMGDRASPVKTTPFATASPQVFSPPLQNDVVEMVHTFEQKSRELAERVQDRQLVVGMLTEMAAKLCASPTLFFRYRPELQAAVLATDSGFGAGHSPATLSFPLDSEASYKIITCIEDGKIASLANYEPLAKLLLARMGIAVFDAWAVTAPGVSGTKLLGVLVILQSSAQSAMHFETLVRMMRTTGKTLQNIPQQL